tara:strand:+ start:3951 stop:4778 length:828 start_codon:yes stop_codon:yes gene_type:complete
MNIVGLGDAGCNIAEAFTQYPQYKIFKINVDNEGKGCYNIPILEKPEEYESYSYPKIKTFFKGMKGDVVFIVGGSGKISCGSLRILETIKNRNISILYIKPDDSLLDDESKMIDKLVYNVLQEYTRSGVFEKMMIVSNAEVDKVIGGAPIIGYFDKLNELIVPTIHMINYFSNNKPVSGSIPKPKETHRIYTVGLFDTKKNEEKMFFSLDNSRNKCYIYGVNEEKLKTDKNLMKTIKKQMDSKREENVSVAYAVYSTEYEYDIGYVISRTPNIQK